MLMFNQHGPKEKKVLEEKANDDCPEIEDIDYELSSKEKGLSQLYELRQSLSCIYHKFTVFYDNIVNL